MYNLLIALAAGVVATIGFGFILGGGTLSIWYGLVPGILALIGVYIYLARRSFKQMRTYVEKAQQQVQNQNIDPAVDILKEAYPIADWQFLIKSQIDGQIGTILYSAKRFDEAEQYLKRASSAAAIAQNWIAPAMLGVYYYKQQKYDKMREIFEDAVTANQDKPLLWNLYAYCLWKSRNRSDAIDVLNRALDHNENDEKTEQNLNALKNGNKMKMRGWGNVWYQFHLDRPPQQQMRQQIRHQRR
jgi:tetratricopeptide (TPR) repeat protein